MRLFSAVCAVALCAGLARANEIPPTQLASLGWAMSASSGAVSSGGGAGPGGGISGALAVYAGCTAPPAAPDSYPSSKDWYFDVANGHPPAYYDNLGVPEAQWGRKPSLRQPERHMGPEQHRRRADRLARMGLIHLSSGGQFPACARALWRLSHDHRQDHF